MYIISLFGLSFFLPASVSDLSLLDAHRLDEVVLVPGADTVSVGAKQCASAAQEVRQVLWLNQLQ